MMELFDLVFELTAGQVGQIKVLYDLLNENSFLIFLLFFCHAHFLEHVTSIMTLDSGYLFGLHNVSKLVTTVFLLRNHEAKHTRVGY